MYGNNYPPGQMQQPAPYYSPNNQFQQPNQMQPMGMQPMGMQPMGMSMGMQPIGMQPVSALGSTPEYPEQKIRTSVPMSQNVTCCSCKQKVSTGINKKLSTQGCIFLLLLCFCLPPFCLIILCMDSQYDHIHFCPNCKANLSYHL